MDATILIPTYNASHFLARLLDSLTVAKPAPGLSLEVLVVNNNCTDRTSEILEHRRGLPIHTAFETQPGKSHALNRGLDHARGTFVAFLDHDVVVAPDYLIGLRDTIRTSPHRVFGGRVKPLWSTPAPPWLNGGRPLQTSRGGIIVHDYGESTRVYGDTMRLPVGCNFVCQRSLFEIVGRFDPCLGPRPTAPIAGEEMDMLRRFLDRGEVIVYTPAISVLHPVDPARATKRYARHRLFCEGRTARRASLKHDHSPTLLGAPRYLYRQLAANVIHAASAIGRPDGFDRQLDAWHTLGAIYESFRILRRGLDD